MEATEKIISTMTRWLRCEIAGSMRRTGQDQHAPLKTLAPYRDHGHPKARLGQDVEAVHLVLKRLPELGVNIDQAIQQLEEDGVDTGNQPFGKLKQTLAGTSSRM